MLPSQEWPEVILLSTSTRIHLITTILHVSKDLTFTVRINKRFEKTKYEPEIIRSSTMSNERNGFMSYESRESQHQPSISPDRPNNFTTFYNGRINAYNYYPRRQNFRDLVDPDPQPSFRPQKKEDDDLTLRINSLKN